MDDGGQKIQISCYKRKSPGGGMCITVTGVSKTVCVFECC